MDNWKKEARQTVFNKLAFIGDSGQEYVDKVVFPFVQKLLSAKDKEWEEKTKEAIDEAYSEGYYKCRFAWMGQGKFLEKEKIYKKYGVAKIRKESNERYKKGI